ncbi:glutathione S-transferase [Shinella sp. AETb1-6]|jgi:glutathione S-transferase|uniref:Glutathione S-transferase family protein n=1 Tax=Shinella sumterensis TaxID=1967501 RepID=A0AA50CN59_9HYPH|nr:MULTISPECIES: glutathione S-transferase family protein [Shinella]MDP9591849.1 glutathione S-transferase [Shinella zoogloeoides]MXN51812.1 glutathione S-transferase [Shinella sp. AETb1-6]WLR99095.1 glutathione S-transferase family protein [Shinella sumterensis]
MKIFYSSTSPYSTKVRMAAQYAGLAAEAVVADTAKDPAELLAANPLGKIPALVTDDGLAVFDSRAIMNYIDRQSRGALYPRNAVKRTEVDVLEATADGICDCLLAIVYERRSRPEDKVYQPWIDRQWQKVERALDHLEANMPRLGKKPNAGHFALAAMLRYIELRFAGQWQRGRPKLKRYLTRFEAVFPDYAAFKD